MIVFRNSETSKLHLLIISFFKILKNKNQENVESEQNISVTDCKKSKNCLDSGLNLNNWCKSCHGDPTINLAYQQQANHECESLALTLDDVIKRCENEEFEIFLSDTLYYND